MEMLQELDILNSGFSALRHHSKSDGDSSSEAESIDGLGDESGNGTVLSPSCIPAYDRFPPSTDKSAEDTWKNNTLIEFFAGWSVAHASSHRRFVAITKSSEGAYSKWGHVSQELKMSDLADQLRRLRC